MVDESGFDIHLQVFDSAGRPVEELRFPNSIDSHCGCYERNPLFQYYAFTMMAVGTGLSTGKTRLIRNTVDVGEDVRIWGFVSPFHNVHPLVDSRGRNVSVVVREGYNVKVSMQPKRVRRADLSEPIPVNVRMAFATPSTVVADLYWTLDELSGSGVTLVRYRYPDSDYIQTSLNYLYISRIADVNVGGTRYCRITLFDFFSKYIGVVIYSIEINMPWGLRFRLVFPTQPTTVQHACYRYQQPAFVVDIPKS